ncbi:MAG: hypothetical protein IJ711_02260 [Lachnospiraceae bacterium]|nr:hypothetical protein [Lachnospiraceae bacterium]
MWLRANTHGLLRFKPETKLCFVSESGLPVGEWAVTFGTGTMRLKRMIVS